jgi:YcaO-like protein with predicted kinase domain
METTLSEDLTCAGSLTVDLGSTMRRVSAATTLSWITPKLRALGITRVADITGLDNVGIPVAIAVRPLARSISVSQGKGPLLDAAMVSAVMESIEVWHAEHLGAPIVVAPYERLTQDRRCIPSSELVPEQEPLDLHHDAIAEPWYYAFDVMSSEEVLIPEAALSINTVGRSIVSSTRTSTTNGLASGNDRVEAICHSAFEILERHGFAAWYRMAPAKRAETSIDLNGIGGLNGSLIDRIKTAGLRLNVFDLSAQSLGLPCYVAEISGDGTPFMTRPYTGRGLHVSAEIALTRAITESAQSRLAMISGAREDNFDEDYYLRGNPQDTRAAIPAATVDHQRLQAWIEDPIGFLRSLLLAHDFQRWILYDHTHPELGVPVVHGFIPGMEHLKV